MTSIVGIHWSASACSRRIYLLEEFKIIAGGIFFAVEVGGSNGGVMVLWMVFCVIISQILTPFFPINSEVSLMDPVPYPIIPHIGRFRASLFHRIVGDPRCSGVIGD